jgi:HEAT repeat protein
MPLIRKPSGGIPPTAPAASLRATDPDARWAAARALTGPEGAADLEAALAVEADARVREAILTSLARIGTPQSARAVIPYIRTDDAALRTGALDALRAMPDAVVASLPELLSDSDADVRLLACEIVRAISGPEATRLLCDLLDRDLEPNVCAAAIEVLAEVGGPEALPALERCAARFSDHRFLAFSIRVAAERLGARRSGSVD